MTPLLFFSSPNPQQTEDKKGRWGGGGGNVFGPDVTGAKGCLKSFCRIIAVNKSPRLFLTGIKWLWIQDCCVNSWENDAARLLSRSSIFVPFGRPCYFIPVRPTWPCEPSQEVSGHKEEVAPASSASAAAATRSRAIQKKAGVPFQCLRFSCEGFSPLRWAGGTEGGEGVPPHWRERQVMNRFYVENRRGGAHSLSWQVPANMWIYMYYFTPRWFFNQSLTILIFFPTSINLFLNFSLRGNENIRFFMLQFHSLLKMNKKLLLSFSINFTYFKGPFSNCHNLQV